MVNNDWAFGALALAVAVAALSGCGSGPGNRAASVAAGPRIYSVRTDGTDARTLDVTGTALSRGSDGQIAFLHGDRLAVMTEDGRNVRLLAPANYGSEDPRAPAWSPDGQRVAVGNGTGCDPYADCAHLSTWIVNVKTGARRRVTVDGEALSWSADGRAIAFENRPRPAASLGQPSPDGATAIFTARADGRGKLRIARGYHPAWSPRRRLIAYAALTRQGAPRGLHLVQPNGRRDRRVINEGTFPGWSPGGSHLAFIAPIWSVPTRGLFVLSLDSGRRHRVSRERGGYVHEFAWSPDGSKLVWAAFDVRRDLDRLFVASVAATQNPVEIAATPPRARITTPVFSSDGTRVLYSQE